VVVTEGLVAIETARHAGMRGGSQNVGVTNESPPARLKFFLTHDSVYVITKSEQ
jgi:hypothetical protein